MDKKSLLIGGGIGAVVVGVGVAINKAFNRPMTAEEMRKTKFIPNSSMYDHPFYPVWASIPKNMESLEKMTTIFEKAFLASVRDLRAGGNFNPAEITDRQRNLLEVVVIKSTIGTALIRMPEEIEDHMDIGFDPEIDPASGITMYFNPYDGRDPATLTKDEMSDKIAIDKIIRNNKQLIRKASRFLAEDLIERLLIMDSTAEPFAKVMVGELNPEDLTDDELKEIIRYAFTMFPQKIHEIKNEKIEEYLRML